MIKDMDIYQYTVRVHPAVEGGFWAEVPALQGCFTQGETVDEVMARASEAVNCYLIGLFQRGEAFPVEKRAKRGFVFPMSVRLPKLA